MTNSRGENWVEVVRNLTVDLPDVDLNLISKDLELLDNILNVKDQYFFLTDICRDKSLVHPSWLLLAGRIRIKEIKSEVPSTFSAAVRKMKSSAHEDYFSFVMENKEELDKIINEQRDWKFNIFAVETLLKSYLARVRKDKKVTIMETPQYMWLRVATYLWFPNMERIKQTYEDLSKGDYIHASPTLFNAGTYRPQLASCFLLTVEDSTDGIVKTHGDLCYISKNSGGIGLDVTSLRHSDIGNNTFINEGIIPWMRMFNEALKGFNQGGKRKGSGAMYLRTWHIDVEEFLDLRKSSGPEDMRARELFYALWVSDEFMRRVRSNEDWTLFCPNKVKGLNEKWGFEFEMAYKEFEKKAQNGKISNFRVIKARELWKKIILTQIETGMPYIVYCDSSNRKSNQKNLGTIKSSNLCVSGNTFVLTYNGHIQIKNLVDQKVDIWNGKQWSNVTVRKTGENQNLIRVNFSNGVSIDCTPYHKFFISDGVERRADELKIGDELEKWSLPNFVQGTMGNEHFKYPYTHGYLCGSGSSKIIIKREDAQLLRFINYDFAVDKGDNFEITLREDIEKIYSIPQQTSKTQKINWFEGLCDSCGVVLDNRIELHSKNRSFFLGVKFFLQTIGVDADLKFEKGDWIITLYSIHICILKMLLFCPKRLKMLPYRVKTKPDNISVIGIEQGPQSVDTYCFKEHKRGRGMFNGIVTGQCSEIIEYTDNKNIASCNLASIALNSCVSNGKFDFEKLERITANLVRNLNQVIDRNYYIEKVPEIESCNLRNRPIGIGVQGLADVFAMMDYNWESKETSQLNKDIFETMYYAAIKESVEIAKEVGPYETFKGSPASKGQFQFDLWDMEQFEREMRENISKNPEVDIEFLRRSPRKSCSDRYDWESLRKEMITHGLRNSLLIALMPTASTANILGNNECFEPFTTHIYTRSVLSGQFVIINRHLVKDLQEIGLWNQNTVENINKNMGSIQGLSTDGLSEEIADRVEFLKKKYKTVFEIPQKTLLQMSLDRGRFVCQSQSFNCWMKNPTFAKMHAFHMYGWERGIKTGLYYLRQPAQYNPIDFSSQKLKLENPQVECTDEVCVSCSS